MKSIQRVLISLALLAVASLALLIAYAAGGGRMEWSTDTQDDFVQGAMDGVDVWSEPGTARLDHRWWPNAQVNDISAQSKLDPRLSFVLTDTGSTTGTIFLAVWADERHSDQYPDIFFARSTDGGQSWSSDVQISDDCYPSTPPYPDCPSLHTPNIAVRKADESLWVVWHQDQENTGPDPGDIYYATSNDRGTSWTSATPVYTGTGKQLLPRIAPHAQSGYLYTIWEDERDDGGDIYISRYTGTVWETPFKLNNDSTTNEQSKPALAVDSVGNVYAIWEDRRADPDGYDSQVYFSRWISGTTWDAGNWSANVCLSNPSMDWAKDPDITTGAGGMLLAAWTERVPTGPATYDFQIVVARSDDGGTVWNHAVVHRLTGASASNAFYANPAVGVDLLGRVYVAWLYSPDSQAATSNVLFALSPDGGLHWTEPRVLNQPSNQASVDTVPALALGFDGQAIVAWMDFRAGASTQVYAAGYPADHYLDVGTYSRTLDAEGPANWGAITWTATISPGSGLQIATRVMTATGAAWTDWVTHTTSGAEIPHPSARFLQYRTSFTSNGNSTPALDNVHISYEQYRVYVPLVARGAQAESIDITQLVETDDDILGISDLVPDPYADAIAAGARVVNLEPMNTFFVLWVPEGYEDMASRRVMVIAHGHTGNAYREIGLELGFSGEPSYAIVAIQWWSGQGEEMYSGQQFYEFMDVALRYMAYKYGAQLDKCAYRGWSMGSGISYEVTYLDRSSGNNRLALTISHDGGMMPDPDDMSVGQEFTQNLYDGVYGDDAFEGKHFYLYAGAEPQIGYMSNTAQVLTSFGGVVERLVADEGAGHDGFYIHPQYHEEALNIFYQLTTP